MKAFLQKAAYRLQQWMQGRYGRDELSIFLAVVSVLLMLLGVLIRPRWFLAIPAWLILIYSTFRMFSKNLPARAKERSRYMEIRGKLVRKYTYLKNRWKDRKEYNYYTCPKCRAHVRIRKPSKGKTILVTCPKCGEAFRKKT